MWCHLCKLNFTNYETFKCHIMEKHKSSRDFYKDDSSSEKSENSIEIPDDFDFDSDMDEDTDFKDVNESSSPRNTLKSPVSGPKVQSRYTLRKRKSNSYELSSSPNSDERLSLSPVIENSKSTKNDQHCNLSSSVDKNTQNQITYIMNPSFSNTEQLADGFDINIDATLKWFIIHQALCQNMKYPLPSSLFEKVQRMQKEICRKYCMCPTATEATEVILNIYEDLSSIIFTHIKSINELMS